jgi:precorrin-4 methylase
VARNCASTTPVAVISKAAIQDCRAGTLADIADRIDGVTPPAIIVIGEVVSLRNVEPMDGTGIKFEMNTDQRFSPRPGEHPAPPTPLVQ